MDALQAIFHPYLIAVGIGTNQIQNPHRPRNPVSGYGYAHRLVIFSDHIVFCLQDRKWPVGIGVSLGINYKPRLGKLMKNKKGLLTILGFNSEHMVPKGTSNEWLILFCYKHFVPIGINKKGRIKS